MVRVSSPAKLRRWSELTAKMVMGVVPGLVTLLNLGIRKGGGGGQNVSCDFGGGKRNIKCPLKTQFWRPQKMGFIWSVPISSKENDIA